MRLLGLLVLAMAIPVSAEEYAGSAACAGCHSKQIKEWQQSDHFHAMQRADASSVLADFAGEYEFHDSNVTLSQVEGQYFYEEADGKHPVAFTFGHSPLQQYLVETTPGQYHALNVAWDSRPEGEGGQRWFHLRDEATRETPFAWQRHFQNWNSRCADCHSTGVTKTIDPDTAQARIDYAEINVACEACHGPASVHVAYYANEAAGEMPPKLEMVTGRNWVFGPDDPIAQPSGAVRRDDMNMCGGCHSRRSVIGDQIPGASYHEQYQLSLLEPGLYHADGQIDDEVFVLGSFMQSKMYQQGVTCVDCHEPHTGQIYQKGNGLCAQCHNPSHYDKIEHTLHVTGHPGSACVDCHMPAKTYMQIDGRRDHRFGVPNLHLSKSLGVPNACENCHESGDPLIAADPAVANSDHYAEVNARLRRFDPLASSDALAYVGSDQFPSIKRASLLVQLPVDEAALQASSQLLGVDDALLRSAAVRKISEAPVRIRDYLLRPILSDGSLLVRKEAARALAELVPDLSIKDLPRLMPSVNEYRKTLSYSLDMPSGLTSLALLEYQLGRRQLAENLLNQAIVIEPDFIPAVLNLADMHREKKDESAAVSLLSQAVSSVPDSAAANHSYGLALVRQGKTEQALEYFRLALDQADRQPRYAYVYAVALDSVEQTELAVKILARASSWWPNQFQLLILEVMYREKAGLIEGIEPALVALRRIAPDRPEVRSRLSQFGLE